ncbi:hypothetical protein V8C86DRAFT_563383 [Haematococcus lacustris]
MLLFVLLLCHCSLCPLPYTQRMLPMGLALAVLLPDHCSHTIGGGNHCHHSDAWWGLRRYTHDHVISLPEPSWGMDSDFLIQPAVYAFHDSTAHEVAASSSVRALRGLSSLSQLWLPRNERWAVQLTDETVPAPLSGPDPADLLRDSVEDADKPAIAITVPSDIASYLPPGMPNVLLQRPITPYRVTLTGGGGPQTPGPTAPDASASKPYELMRQRRQSELDAAKRAARLSSVQELDSRIDGYNSTLRLPCHFALAL